MKTGAFKADGSGFIYRGSLKYAVSTTGTLTLVGAEIPSGMLTPDGPCYMVKDHLGSIVYEVNASTSTLANGALYDEWGGRDALAGVASSTVSCRHYTGKEDQWPDFSVPYTDFGARHYSPALRRWLSPDPLSEKYYTSSPYAYCADNPINLVDPDGRTIRDKIAGILIGSVTNVIPSTGFVRDLYSPQDSEDYNRALSISDNAAKIVAGGMISGGLGLIASGEAAQGAGALLAITGIGAEAGAVSFASGAAITVTGEASVFIGSVMMASSLDNSKAGYNRGKPESSTTSSVKRGGESEAARIGREKHLQYNPGDGYRLNTALPSNKRPDAYNVDLGIVRELKPNNPRAIKKGQKQVEGYKKELQELYPNKEWKAYVDTY